MRIAWGERAVPDGTTARVTELLESLEPWLAEPWTGPEPQLIHGDLGGNMLFADGRLPAIIDMSPHLAPAPFAEAIIVADTVAWEGAPVDFADWYATTRPHGRQLLARAVVYRVFAAVLGGVDPTGGRPSGRGLQAGARRDHRFDAAELTFPLAP